MAPPTVDPAWSDWVTRWLGRSWRVDNDAAGFANIDSRALRQPGLTATYAAVGVLTAAGREVEDAAAVTTWIDSLRVESGAYVESGSSGLPPLVQSYFALATLERLGRPPEHSDDTVAFVSRARRLDGLYDLRDGDDTEALGAVVGTYYAAEILRILGTPEAVRLRAAVPAALRVMLLGAGPADAAPERRAGETARFLVAAWTVAGIDATELPELVAATTSDLLDDVVAGRQAVGSQIELNLLLDLADALDLPAAADGATPVRRLVARDVTPLLPQSRHEEAALDPLVGDPVTRFEAVRLATRAGLEVPEHVYAGLDRLRVAEGWAADATHPLDPATTVAAIGIARRIGYGDYDAALVSRYVADALVEATLAGEAWPEVYALEAANLPGGGVVDADAAARLYDAFAVLPDTDATLGAAAAVAEISLARSGAVPAAVTARLQRELDQALDVPGPVSLRHAHDAAVVWALVGGGAAARDRIEGWVRATAASDGGFHSGHGGDEGTMDSTFLAVRALQALGRLADSDVERVRGYVERARLPFGYGFFAAPASIGPARADRGEGSLLSTYQGMWLLENLPA